MRGFCVLALVFVVSGFSRTVVAQTVDADAVYKANCATCHDQPTGRTPSKDALKERTADQILLALTSGSMSIQGVSLSVAERRALAEHLSGKPLGGTAHHRFHLAFAGDIRLHEHGFGAFAARLSFDFLTVRGTQARNKDIRPRRGERYCGRPTDTGRATENERGLSRKRE